MSNERSFAVGMDFKHVHKTISEHVYETPLAFLRENVQNALDAIRMQAHSDGKDPGDADYTISIMVSPTECVIRDNGIGMSEEDLQKYFWTIGASGKRSVEAREAGCVGMFGIGGFANFGICDEVTVTSRRANQPVGTLTRLTQYDIDNSTTEFPRVYVEESNGADPRGTVITGHFKKSVDVNELMAYIIGFVRYSKERITFNEKGVISQQDYFDEISSNTLRPIGDKTSEWSAGNLTLSGQWFCTMNHGVVVVRITGARLGSEDLRLNAMIRMENGPIDVLKRGFKLCATTVQTRIGVSGRIDCDRLSPTAGRDSLNAESSALVQNIAAATERCAVQQILNSSELLKQHGRIYRYVIQNGLVEHLGHAEVDIADGTVMSLGAIRKQAENGVGVFFGTHQKQALSQIMQARGNLVVILSTDRYRQNAVESYLTSYCGAKPFSGIVEVQEFYGDLDRFDRVFVSEMEHTIHSEYDIAEVKFILGRLTEDIPVYVSDIKGYGPLTVLLDVKHPEVSKLRKLEFGPLLYSLIGTFCREYLSTILRKNSPKFFGSGAINLDSLERRRSELWVLVKDDIHTMSRTTKRQVVRRADVHTITAGGGGGAPDGEQPLVKAPKLLRIQGDEEFAQILGYYIRIPDPATAAFGDVIKQYDNRGVVWAGNKVLFVASDGISSAFQFEVRLERVIAVDQGGQSSNEGAEQMARPVQELAGGLYFPLPDSLENVFVPIGDEEIRIEVSSGDWIDTQNAHSWRAKIDDQEK